MRATRLRPTTSRRRRVGVAFALANMRLALLPVPAGNPRCRPIWSPCEVEPSRDASPDLELAVAEGLDHRHAAGLVRASRSKLVRASRLLLSLRQVMAPSLIDDCVR